MNSEPQPIPASAAKTRVVLVEDHVAIRQMLAFILKLEGGYEVVGEATGGVEALRVCRATRPELVILDLALPELNGGHLIRVLRNERWPMRVLVFTGSADDALLRAALAEEPDALVRKEDPLPELREALRAVSAGRRYLSPWAVRHSRAVRTSELARLSTQELAVLQMIAEGHQTKEIAETLGAAPKTVDHHRQHLMEKLGLHDVASLTRFAVRNHLVEA